MLNDDRFCAASGDLVQAHPSPVKRVNNLDLVCMKDKPISECE